MKKIFTLFVALFAVIVYANADVTTESYVPTDDDGIAKQEWPATATEGQQNVVDIDATANVHLKAVSGAISGWNEGTTLPLAPKFENNWDVKNNRNNVWDEKLGATKTLYFLNGKGNPTSGVAFVEKRTDGQKTGTWRACFDKANDPEGPYIAEDGVTEIPNPNFYYQPDGSAGLPSKYGVYYQVTAKTAGTMKFLIWNNKGTRLVYVADGTTGVALDPTKGEVKYSGYVNGKDEFIDPADETKGKKMTFFENLVPQEGKEYCPQAEINAGQAAWIYLTFEMEAGKTYYIFNHNTQLGFGGFTFTFEDTPTPAAEESYVPTDEQGVAKQEWPATATEGQQNVVDIDATANVHLKAVSGAISGWNEGTTLPLAPKFENNWDVKNNRNNVWDEKLGATKTLYFLNGKGNPTSGVAFVEKRTDGQKTGTWRACFDKANDPEGPYIAEDGVTEIPNPNFYYQPDGSAGLPSKYGVYYQVTAKTAGTMKFLIWNNKGTRLVYVADGTTGVALDPTKGEVKYSGYVNGKDEFIDPADETKGKKMTFFENLVPQEGKEYCPQAEINAGQAAWIYLTFEMEAGKTYYIFNHNTQLGFGGFTFTPGGTSGIEDIIVEKSTAVEKKADNRMFNLQGVQVDKNYKGVVIMNGKRFLQR
ncbi:MAG: hypothetical protein Q3994_03465 [Prevotella sp.]|nr:hypothetical protein [Prevotella sp.]